MLLERMFGVKRLVRPGCGSRHEFSQLGSDHLCQFRGLIRHGEQRGDRASQGTTELATIQRMHERALELPQEVVGQLVEVSTVVAVEPTTSAGEVKGMIANRADPVLRLPISASPDAGSRMKRMVDGISEQLARRRGRIPRWLDGFPNSSRNFGPPAPNSDAGANERSSSRESGSRNTRHVIGPLERSNNFTASTSRTRV